MKTARADSGYGGGSLAAQGLDPAALLKPPTDTWPTYNGDYSGRRFSPLDRRSTPRTSAR